MNKIESVSGVLILKKAVALFTAIIMIFSVMSVSAAEKDDGYTDLPVVLVCGYAGPQLSEVYEDGSKEQVWYPDFGEIPQILLSRIAEVALGLGESVFGSADYIAKVVGEEAEKYLEKVKCNDDGSSMYNLMPTVYGAEETNSQVLFDRFGDESYQYETDITRKMREHISRSQIYNFTCDWRMGAVECAQELDKYIQQVKERDGCDRVNIFCLSHGGQVTATYLTLFGWKQDVKNACMTVPAAGGAGIVYDLLTADIKFDELNLIKFIEHGTVTEDDYHWLVEAQQLGFLDKILDKLVPYLYRVVGNWGSIWDFCPSSIYEDMKTEWLDETANAEIIKKSDYMHYSVMPQFYTELQKCNDEYGMNVSIIAGTDIGMVTGWANQGDGIICTAFSTGAECTDVGMRFPDGYIQKNPCGGKYKLSPEMTVDASTAYLPDNTWFVSGLYHGMTYWDEFTRELLILLTLTDSITDVYSDKRFPQFHASTNPSNTVWAAFDKSVEGYVCDEDTCLTVKNLTDTGRDLLIKSVICDTGDIHFKVKPFTVLKQGESVDIPFTGKLPEKSNCRVNIIISYTARGSVTPLGERTLAFTLRNGEIPVTDGETVSSQVKTPFDRSVFGFMSGLLKTAGLYSFVTMIYTVTYYIFESFQRFIFN